MFISKWSEHHAAGLGTFGLCDGLITAKGMAHRVESVIEQLAIPPQKPPYHDHHTYYLFFHDASRTGCLKRYPVGAISKKGHDKVKCGNRAWVTCAEFVKERYGFDGYGCGLCQTVVPCQSGMPKKITRSLDWL